MHHTLLYNEMKRFQNITFFLFFFLSASLCLAVELPSINKTKIRISIIPGQSGYGDIVVENTTAEERAMRVYLGDWTYLPAADGTKEFSPAGTTPLSCASWITFSPAEFVLKPFTKQKVSYSVKVPPDAKGGHYAALFFESMFGKIEQRGGALSAGMNIAIRIATLFYLEPESTIIRTAALENFKIDRVKEEYVLSCDLKNTGNVDITAGGTFHLIDRDGIVQLRGEFKDVYTFPGGSASLQAVTPGMVLPGTYSLVMTIDLGRSLEEENAGSEFVLTKEAEVEVGSQGEILRLGSIQ